MAFGMVGWCVGAGSPVAFLADSRETDPPQMLRESDAFRAIFGRLLQQGYNQRVAMTEM
jgi:hypothetical protein